MQIDSGVSDRSLEATVAVHPSSTVQFSRTSTTDPPNWTFRRASERRGSASGDENFTRAFEQGLWPSPGRRGAANERAEPRQRGGLRAALREEVVVSGRLEAYLLSVRPQATKKLLWRNQFCGKGQAARWPIPSL